MYANLFEHETIPNREKLNRIADAISINGISPSEWERRVIAAAVAQGFAAEEAEGYLLGDPSC